jgi:hypothetical protein
MSKLSSAARYACNHFILTASLTFPQLVKSLPDNTNRGSSLTSVTAALAKKCLGDIENAKAKHAIWILVTVSLVLYCLARLTLFQRDLIRSDPELRECLTDAGNDDDDNDNIEFPSTIPAKRTHNGTVKVHTSDGKLIAAFWDRTAVHWKRKTTQFGTSDLKSEAWTECVLFILVRCPALTFSSSADTSTLVWRRRRPCSRQMLLPSLSGAEALLLQRPHPSIASPGCPNTACNLRLADPGHPQCLVSPLAVHWRRHSGAEGVRSSFAVRVLPTDFIPATIDHLMNTPTDFTGVPSGSGMCLTIFFQSTI